MWPSVTFTRMFRTRLETYFGWPQFPIVQRCRALAVLLLCEAIGILPRDVGQVNRFRRSCLVELKVTDPSISDWDRITTGRHENTRVPICLSSRNRVPVPTGPKRCRRRVGAPVCMVVAEKAQKGT